MKRLFSILLALCLTLACVSGICPAAFAEGEESSVIVITKTPGSERVTEGEDALFVSRAAAYTGLVWQLVSPDGETVFDNDAALNAFPGLDMSGFEGEELTLISIPYSLNGWSVRTKFIDRDGNWALTDEAQIVVLRGAVPAPEVRLKSSGAQLKAGERKTLSVEATSPGGDVLKYQWYRSYSAARNSGEPILGATGSSYTPPEETGQVFYYAGVWCVNGRMSSAPVYTSPVAIIYTAAAVTPEPEPTPEPTPLPTLPPPSRSEPGENFFDRSNAFAIAFGGMAMLTALAIGLAWLLLRAIGRKQEREETLGDARGESDPPPEAGDGACDKKEKKE